MFQKQHARWAAVLLLSVIPFAFAVLYAAFTRTPERFAQSVEAGNPDKDVLIVFTVGVPYRTISDMSAAEVEAVSGATPASFNTMTLSSELAYQLRSQGYSVTLKGTEEVASYREILEHRVLVLASPVRFWNMHWKMKKFMEETFEPIYVAEQSLFREWPVAGFVMAESSSSAEAALETIRSVMGDCGTDLSVSTHFLTDYSMFKRNDRLERLAAGIARLVSERK